MTISSLTKKISSSLLSKSLLVVSDKVGGIIKIFDVVPSILFRSIPGPANKIFNYMALTFFYYLFAWQLVYLKEFDSVSVTVEKHGGGYVKTGAM